MRTTIETYEGITVKKFTQKCSITGKLLKSYQADFNNDRYTSDVVVFPHRNYFASSFAKDVLSQCTQ